MQASVGPSPSQANPSASRARFGVVSLLFITVVINYMDRANLSVAAPALARDLHLTSAELGWAFSAFGWTYAALQIPGGWLVDVAPPPPALCGDSRLLVAHDRASEPGGRIRDTVWIAGGYRCV